VLDRIADEAFDEELIRKSVRMVKRAAVPFNDYQYTSKLKEPDTQELGKTDAKGRREEAQNRQKWEAEFQTKKSEVGSDVSGEVQQGRSALSRREANSEKPDLFMSNVMSPTPDTIATIVKEKKELQNELEEKPSDGKEEQAPTSQERATENHEAAANRVSELIVSSFLSNRKLCIPK
jgi:hypothetical protein